MASSVIIKQNTEYHLTLKTKQNIVKCNCYFHLEKYLRMVTWAFSSILYFLGDPNWGKGVLVVS